MEITITLRDIESGQVEIEETRLPCSGETVDSVTTASALADELRKCANKLGQIETTACEIPLNDDETDEWQEV
jgi:hypothetical protein